MPDRFKCIEAAFKDVVPAGVFCQLRVNDERHEAVTVRQGIPKPVETWADVGAMVTVYAGGGMGYCATGDMSVSGLRVAVETAMQWASMTAGRCVVDFDSINWPNSCGDYVGACRKSWDSVPLAEKFSRLTDQCAKLKIDDRIVDWETYLWNTKQESMLLTSEGGRIRQSFSYMMPGLRAVANEGAITEERTFGGHGALRQGGMEVLDDIGFWQGAPTVAAEALELLTADNCPTGEMDVLFMPDQMILQIHESIGHPLELDRILGDERNYAGTSFVTMDMFGSYKYGTDLLNITFDPTISNEAATYAYDDDGLPAEKAYIIKGGVLQRPEGGLVSQTRMGSAGVANSRACSWNRPPIDRISNLNLEPGESSLDEMIGSIDHGICMKTNCSWSIDDSRNKFQFGCEWGRLIENGKLTSVVRKPNYRGISATFWQSLKMVGDGSTVDVLGTPYCGKGEPNQCVRVGHSSPACVFGNVDVFGGE